MASSLEGRHAVVTGGGRGIGAAVAEALAGAGARLTVMGRSRDALEAEAEKLRESQPAKAQQLAEDIGAISREDKWPLNCIDWAEAARELQVDYSSVTFGGVDYWIRS
jgi:NAD(P)-dependent dehydrogenase (short-subunit alcohol dehydrogenase family)